jgi:hypothetical protein
LDILKAFVGRAKVIHMVVEYDTKNLMPLITNGYSSISNPNVNGTIERTIVDDDEKSIFGVMTSNEVTLQGLLRNELTLICHLSMKLKDIILPLIWWKTHEA